MRQKDLVGLNSITKDDLDQILALAKDVKQNRIRYQGALSGKVLAMIFQKPSTRTRVSFQAAMMQTGGHAMVLGQHELQLGRGETISDTAKVLSRYVDAIMARVFSHNDIVGLAENASVPVINGLSDLLHPCQALADYQTMIERFGDLKGLPLTYVGDGNNVAHSLAFGAAKLGVKLTIGCPKGFEPDPKILSEARKEAQTNGAELIVENDPQKAVKDAMVVYSDVWASMGEEAQAKEKNAAFKDFQVNDQLFSQADPKAIFMHCLPAHRGEEVTDEIADHERSLIFDQAENRLHAQKALLIKLLCK